MNFKIRIKNSLIFCLILLATLRSFSQDNQNKFQYALDKFEKLDGNSLLQGGILFTGSSSIEFWKNPEKDFNNNQILNRGVGGFQMSNLIENFDQIILKYHPKKVVVYCGDNDIKHDKSAEIVFGDFCTLYGMLKATLPEVKLYYISIKPSINRWPLVIEILKANTMINEFLNTKDNGTYVDVFSQMISKNGLPKEKLFIEDGVHMTPKGYRLWTKILKPYISE
mgnify:CR=1 FL=1